MLSINTNLSSLIAQSSMKQSTNKLNLAIERMSTGFKINHAKDNAANYSIATNMTTKINSYMVAEDNAAMGLDLISTAEGTLSQIQDKLSRLRALAEQSANGTYGEQSKQAINAEANALVDEIERLYNTAEYNGIKLLDSKTNLKNNSVQGFGCDISALPTVGSNGFIKDIEERDLSSFEKIEDFDETNRLTPGNYSISTADGLVKFARIINDNNFEEGVYEFVLAADIDMSAYKEGDGWEPIRGFGTQGTGGQGCITFDGNGHVISNLYINRPNEGEVGLFGLFDYSYGCKIKNLGLENVDITGKNRVGGIVAQTCGVDISNCYTTGNIEGQNEVGGIIGNFTDLCAVNIDSVYSECDVTGNNQVGGIAGNIWDVAILTNSFATGTIKANYGAAGLYYSGWGALNCYFSGEIIGNSNCAGLIYDTYTMTNCLVLGESSSLTYVFGGGELDSCSYSSYYDSLGIQVGITVNNVASVAMKNNVNMQIGINSDSASAINLESWFDLDNLYSLRRIGKGNSDCLAKIDEIMNKISSVSTSFGATSNRLESVLDEISIQYDNLVSSRSTIRDADIAEVSASYIQQQILQQASATLLATANQSPSIALQLI